MLPFHCMRFTQLTHPTRKETQRKQKETELCMFSTRKLLLTVTNQLQAMEGQGHPVCGAKMTSINSLNAQTSWKSLEDRRKHVKDNKLCYGCMKPGHSEKECRHRHTCDVCEGRHPTCIHDENFRGRESRERPVSIVNTAVNTVNDTTAATALNVTRGDQSGSTSMIVPVWVSSAKNPSNSSSVHFWTHRVTAPSLTLK